MNVYGLDFEYLRPPRNVFDIIHNGIRSIHSIINFKGDYILQTEGKKYTRRIFHDVHYTNYEFNKLDDFQALINKANLKLPPEWTHEDVIKYLYSGKFDMKKCLNNLKAHLAWKAKVSDVALGEQELSMLKEGIVYISGRDNQFRPIIVINLTQVKFDHDSVDSFIHALCYALSIAQEFYFVPGKVENWIIMIDTTGCGLLNFPFKIFKKIIEVTSINFPSTLEKIYIMNPSQTVFASWYLIQSVLDPVTSKKIALLKKSDYSQLFNKISQNQIEARYGGTLPEPEESFWPPVNTLGKTPYTQNKKYTEDLSGTQNNLDQSDDTKLGVSDDGMTADTIEMKRERGQRNRGRVKSNVETPSSRGSRKAKRDHSYPAPPETKEEIPDLQGESLPSFGPKTDRGDKTGRFGGGNVSLRKVSTKIKEEVLYNENDEDEDTLKEEEGDFYEDEEKKPHVLRYQSLKKIQMRLSTVKEETFEEGLTSIVMFPDQAALSKSLSNRVKSKSGVGLVSLVLLKNKSEMIEKRTSISPINGNLKMVSSREGTVSFDSPEETKVEIKQQESGLEEIPLGYLAYETPPELVIESKATKSSSFCCRMEQVEHGSHPSKANNESCNIF